VRVLAVFLKILVVAALLLSGAWTTLALWYQPPISTTAARGIGVGMWLLFMALMLALAARHHKGLALFLYLLAFAAVLIWWHNITPRLDRDWAPEVAHTVTGSLEGDTVVLNNVRNFQWQTPKTFGAQWETRRYDLKTLSSVDAILSYWGMNAIAHTLVSFGFSDGTHVVFSVEIRREQGESFSEIGGFFKKFELAFIAADENDIVRLRTNVRREDVYLYPIALPAEARQALFLSYLDAANDLAVRPSFYNTITANCTTVVFGLARLIAPSIPNDWRIVFSGYLPEYFAALGVIDWPKPYGNVREKAAISARALAYPDAPYSEVIRGGQPPVPAATP